ncbi:hypothetical protein MHY87_03750 [Microvirga sp. ACRRW]|uniref:flagellin N-terminal helical domain-containing protein n=1 Tax=Microvirga sp. ACRRW TaxID=2918205 RepID=UPI001EF50AD3|nr:flagellin [Microvirga sp. ACRRW]MCG7392014.1 hypothetical protein [Microvirga sp. ACRRW]
MSSINTNLSAMTALQALKATQTAMNKNQNQISTGLRVGEASHNASYWSIATQMKSDNGALSAVKDSIKQSTAMINTFTSAMDKSLTYLNKMKEGLVAASQPGADRAKIQTEFNAFIEGMKSAAGSATFNGQNWLSGTPSDVNLVVSYDGNTNSVGTLKIDTTKTNLFSDAKAGIGGILHDVASANIAGAEDEKGTVTFDVSSASTGDKLSFTLTGGQEQSIRLSSAENSAQTIADKINGDDALKALVEASVDTDGKLVLTAKEGGKGVSGTFADASAGTTAVDATAHAPVAAGAFTQTLNFTDLAAGDTLTIDTDGTGAAVATPIAITTTSDSVDDLVKAINDDTGVKAAGITASNVDGKLVLTGSAVFAGSYTDADTAGNNIAAANSVATTAGTADLGGYVEFSAADAAPGSKLTISVAGGAEVSYDVVEGDLEALRDAINDVADPTGFGAAGVKANIVDGKLRLTAATDTEEVAAKVTAPTFGTPVAGESQAPVVAEEISKALKAVDEAIRQVTEGSAMLGANKALLETQSEFIGVLSDSLTAGVSAFVDADMNEASTRNQALQTQQQLGVQALSMANQNSQMILRLFQ